MTLYNKLWAAIAGTILLGLAQFLPDNHFTLIEGVQLTEMVAGTILVGYIGNTAVNRYAKFVSQLVAASAPVTLVALADGWQTNVDLWPILIAAATSAGVVGFKNKNYQFLGGTTPPRSVAA